MGEAKRKRQHPDSASRPGAIHSTAGDFPSSLDSVMIALGSAYWSAQILEGNLLVLHSLLDLKRDRDLATATQRMEERSFESTIGELFAELLARKYITDSSKALIRAGIHERNALVHTFWLQNERVLKLESRSGQLQLRRDLKRAEDAIWKAGEVVGNLAETLLKERGQSTSTLALRYQTQVLKRNLRNQLVQQGLAPSMVDGIKWLAD